jgi:hypothetical protein
VATEFPGIETESLLVDAAAMNFIRRPESFDVVVASNLFGDILSDISAIVVGSMGLAASANLDPSRRFPSMFEPVHGSAPDIAGRGVVNPLAAILSAAMMLEHLEQPAAAREVEQAVAAVLAEGKVRTPDLGGANSTQEVTDAVLRRWLSVGILATATLMAQTKWHHRYAEVNGVKLHYVEQGKGELILFLHGFPEFWYEWKDLIPEFAKDHHAVAPDMRGYNLSDKPRRRWRAIVCR